MRMTQAELNAYHARHGGCPDLKKPKGCELESELHDQIAAECRRRGWLYVHSRMDKRTTTAAGVCDFIILTGRVVNGGLLLVEAKTKTGKQSLEQLSFSAHARKMGHTVHVVRSFEEFLKVITQ